MVAITPVDSWFATAESPIPDQQNPASNSDDRTTSGEMCVFPKDSSSCSNPVSPTSLFLPVPFCDFRERSILASWIESPEKQLPPFWMCHLNCHRNSVQPRRNSRNRPLLRHPLASKRTVTRHQSNSPHAPVLRLRSRQVTVTRLASRSRPTGRLLPFRVSGAG
jgi:hypothetical protein